MNAQISTISTDQINEPATKHVEVSWTALLLTTRYGSGEEVEFFSAAEAAAYNADPDGFAAKYFGLTDAEEYREWVACNGAPLCSERSKSGKPCPRRIGSPTDYPPHVWLAFHRSRPCEKHGGDAFNTGPMPPPRPGGAYRRRYPARADRRCEAITKPPEHWIGEAWAWGPHQCGLSGAFKRDGRRVCHLHRDCADVAFISDGSRS